MKHIILFGAALFCHALYGQTVTTHQLSSSSPAVVISELLADPSPQQGLPPVEFVELYNRSSDTVLLVGWTIYDGSGKALPPVKFPPGEYLIICAVSDTGWFSAFGKVAPVTSLSLTNSGEKVSVRDNSGAAVDSLTYSDEWFDGSYKADGGWSLERIDTEFTCFSRSNWTAAENPAGGTPGAVNSVAGVFTDDEAPVALRAFCGDPVTVKVIFSEPLDPQLASLVQADFPIQVTSITAGDQASLILHLADSLERGIAYSGILTGVSDCPGNSAGDQQVLFGLPDTVTEPEVIINEVLFNPSEGGADFIELYNRGNTITDLTRFTVLSYDEVTGQPDEVTEIEGEPWLLFPGAFAVLTEAPEAVAASYRSNYPQSFLMLEDLPAMNIDAGEIGILYNGKPADRFRYSEEDHFALLQDVKGVSLERISDQRPAGDKSNWHSAAETAGFATPGYRNSQYVAFDANQSEVTAVPEIFSPDNDGHEDVVTFMVTVPGAGYIGNILIYHSGGRPVRELASHQLAGTESSYSWDGTTDDGTKAPAGIYVAVLEFFSLQGDVKRYKVPVVLAVKFE